MDNFTQVFAQRENLNVSVHLEMLVVLVPVILLRNYIRQNTVYSETIEIRTTVIANGFEPGLNNEK